MNQLEFFDIHQYFIPKNRHEYRDLSHEYRILVSLDEESTNKLWRCQLHDETDGGINHQMQGIYFHEDTFYYMEENFFNYLNVNLKIYINRYEEEYINQDKIDESIMIVEYIVENSKDKAVVDFGQTLLNLMKIAKKKGTILGFCF